MTLKKILKLLPRHIQRVQRQGGAYKENCGGAATGSPAVLGYWHESAFAA